MRQPSMVKTAFACALVVAAARRQDQQKNADQDWKRELPQLNHRVFSSSFFLSR